MPRIPNSWNETSVIESYQLKFQLMGFKKASYDTFDLSAGIHIRFDRLKYTLHLQARNSPFVLQHFYQEPLVKEEITAVAEKLVRFFLDEIRRKTNGHA